MIQLLEDLRFFIGAFFLIIGALLAVNGVLSPELTNGVNLNLLVGAGFLVFGAACLTLSLMALKKSN